MNQALPRLIAAMSRPEFYPHNPPEVLLRQTHISYVFLAGPYVYKVKKPRTLPFLDYSTLEKRRHFCAEEVRLNRRLAPHTYLATVQIRGANGAFFLDESASGDNPIVEYAVKMNRLPEHRLLSVLVSQGSAQLDHMVAIASKVALFHEQVSVEKALTYGLPAAIAANVRDNFNQARPFVDRTISRRSFDSIGSYNETFMREHAELLLRRARMGRVREGHGDLRAEHICLLEDSIEIFDCIEFDEGLRYNDVASEIGFLSMDLDSMNEPYLAAELETAYAAAAGDPELTMLLPFYKCYRAYVRGKVESLKSDEPEVSERERRQAVLQALRYFYLSTRYARDKSTPMLFIVCGRVGTGKSTVAQMLAALTGFRIFASDRVRKNLAGIAPTAHGTNDYQQGIYSKEFTERTYENLFAAAENRLVAGEGAIIDATFSDPEHRRSFLTLANRLNISALFVECRAGKAVIKRRLEERREIADEVSDATWDVHHRMEQEFASFSDIPQGCHFPIDTEENMLTALSKLEERLQDRRA